MTKKKEKKEGGRRKTGEKEKEEKQQHYYFLEGKFLKMLFLTMKCLMSLDLVKKILGAGNSSSSVFRMDNLSHSRK